jgi:hypothetical protein
LPVKAAGLVKNVALEEEALGKRRLGPGDGESLNRADDGRGREGGREKA